MDMTMDGSPIICKSPVPGLFINGGWCYGGFGGDAGVWLVFCAYDCEDRPHDLNAVHDRAVLDGPFNRGEGCALWAQ